MGRAGTNETRESHGDATVLLRQAGDCHCSVTPCARTRNSDHHGTLLVSFVPALPIGKRQAASLKGAPSCIERIWPYAMSCLISAELSLVNCSSRHVASPSEHPSRRVQPAHSGDRFSVGSSSFSSPIVSDGSTNEPFQSRLINHITLAESMLRVFFRIRPALKSFCGSPGKRLEKSSF